MTPHYISSSKVARYLLKTGSIVFDGKQVKLSFDSQPSIKSINIDEIQDIRVNNGLIWNDIDIILKDGAKVNIDGFRKKEAGEFVIAFENTFWGSYYKYYYENSESFEKELNNLSSQERYFQRNEFLTLTHDINALFQSYHPKKIPPTAEFKERLDSVHSFFKDPYIWISKKNDTFIENEKKEYKDYFESIEPNPLTPSQQSAAITNEINNMVVAGAGSGKTSVIVAKIGYILKKEYAIQDEILVLAFNRDAKEELVSRIDNRLGLSIDVNTFHSFGRRVIAEVNEEMPSLCPWCDDPKILRDEVRNIIKKNYKESVEFRTLFDEYFIQHFAPYKSSQDFMNEGEYVTYLKNIELRTLQGNLVKSHEECEIANYLTFRNIRYDYERDYEHRTATTNRRQYKPDFYLPDYGIYIEHFGIDKNGNPAPYIKVDEYRQGMQWKINKHREHNTKLITTFSYEKTEGNLTKNLEEKLKNYNVRIGHVSFEDAINTFSRNNGVFDRFTNLLLSFMSHYQSNDMDVNKMVMNLKTSQRREKSFLSIFQTVYNDYLRIKSDSGGIDFDDMILMATNYIKENRYLSKYKYILIDEFQDISTARSNLILALRRQVENSIVTVVGDDWQAINRFAGGNISIFKNFEKIYGTTDATYLKNTFRFDKITCDIASEFILKNRNQLSKEVVPFNEQKDNPNSINIYWDINSGNDNIDSVLKLLAEHSSNEQNKKEVCILGRYKHLNPNNLSELKNKYRLKFNIEYKTIHSFKGKEADHIILVGLESGRYGFPSEIEDDPLLNLVLTEADNFPLSEERRLFYVAMTRKRKSLYCIANPHRPSSFISEILKDDNIKSIVQLNYDIKDSYTCSRCSQGIMIEKLSHDGHSFYGCTNYPYCDNSENILVCPRCNEKMRPNIHKKQSECTNTQCTYTLAMCPICHTQLVRRNGRYGEFFGCPNYPDCNHKLPLTDSNIESDNSTANTLCPETNRVRNQSNPMTEMNDVIKNYEMTFKKGDHIIHRKFGEGVVMEYLDISENSIVVVRFVNGATKSLMLKYAKLKKI